jgi:hypothetical protein
VTKIRFNRVVETGVPGFIPTTSIMRWLEAMVVGVGTLT